MILKDFFSAIYTQDNFWNGFFLGTKPTTFSMKQNQNLALIKDEFLVDLVSL